jgi:hypothetical protein
MNILPSFTRSLLMLSIWSSWSTISIVESQCCQQALDRLLSVLIRSSKIQICRLALLEDSSFILLIRLFIAGAIYNINSQLYEVCLNLLNDFPTNKLPVSYIQHAIITQYSRVTDWMQVLNNLIVQTDEETAVDARTLSNHTVCTLLASAYSILFILKLQFDNSSSSTLNTQPFVSNNTIVTYKQQFKEWSVLVDEVLQKGLITFDPTDLSELNDFRTVCQKIASML